MNDLINILDSYIGFLNTPIGVILFVPFYAIWVSLLLPGVWASMLAGFIYGTWLGSLIVFFGACIGAQVAFWMGRTFLKSWFNERLAHFPKLQVTLKAISREGLKFVLLTRLSPAFPFSLLNFAYGLSDVGPRDFSIGLLGILPGTILFCGLGSVAGDLTSFSEVLSEQGDIHAFVIRLLGIAATLAVILLITRSVRQVLEDYDV